jgi:hypothetical protein
MNAVFLLGCLVIIVFAALSIVPFFLLPETSRKRTAGRPAVGASAPGPAMPIESRQPPAPVVAIQSPRSGHDETAGEEVAAG